jgi:histone-binding protein RBBP4
VVWRPGSNAELASVGDDFKLLLWDTRAPTAAAAAVADAHGEADLHCVDWSLLQQDLLVTGTHPGDSPVHIVVSTLA